MKKFTLTKKEFIKRSMKGEVFVSVRSGCKYYYDKSFENPFRFESVGLGGGWCKIDGKNLFTLEEPTPKVERRWRWRRNDEGYTAETIRFVSDEYAANNSYTKDGWYKVEDLYIDVEIKE